MSKVAVPKAVVWLLSVAMICYTISRASDSDRFRLTGSGLTATRIDSRTGQTWSRVQVYGPECDYWEPIANGPGQK